MKHFRAHKFIAQNTFRQETLDGKDYYVVPVIAMIEGVRFGGSQEFPELGLAENFGKFPDSWNTSPVVMNHPQDGDLFLSAGTKEILETQSFGTVLNTQLKGTKLHMEAWLDISKRELSPQVTRVFERIENAEIVEVSVGFFCELADAEIEGTYNEETYKGVWTNIVPDHLAILEEGQIGACSVDQGCGTRIQQIKEENMLKTQCSCTLTDEQKTTVLNALRINTVAEELQSTNIEKVLDIAINKMLGTLWSYVYSFTANTVVYYNSTSMKVEQVEYDMDAEHNVTFKSTPKQVMTLLQVIEIPNVNLTQEGTSMTAQTESTSENVTDETQVTEEIITTEDEAPTTTEVADTEVTAQSYIANAPVAIREVLEEGLRANTAKRTKLIANIKANKANKFDDTFLMAQTTITLENLASLATTTANYSGVASAAPIVAQSEGVPAPLKVFETKK